MILGALLALLAYGLIDVARARHRYLEFERSWSVERKALKALEGLTR